MDLRDAHFMATSLMAEHVPGWRFTFDRAQRRFGQCNYTKRTISLSAPLTVQRDRAAVRNTILHEIAHALTPGFGHGPVWRAMARALGSDGERCSSGEGIQLDYKWLGKCKHGHEYKRMRLTDRARAGTCSICDNKHNPEFSITWEQVR